MKRKIVFATTLLTLYFLSCDRKEKSDPCFSYPKQIDSLQVRDLYDTARLYLFTWLCHKKIDNYYRAQFDLHYKSYFLRNDSLEIFFTHTLPVDFRDASGSDYQYLPSFAFNIKTKEKLWGWDINGFSDGIGPGDPKFENPATSAVIDFLKKNKRILNPCFLELANKAKIFGPL